MQLPIETKGRPLTDYVGEVNKEMGSSPQEFSGTLRGKAYTPRHRPPPGEDRLEEEDLETEENPAQGFAESGPPKEGAEAERTPFISS